MATEKVVIIGDFEGKPDEAMKKISSRFKEFLESNGSMVIAMKTGLRVICRILRPDVQKVYSLSGPGRIKMLVLIVLAFTFPRKKFIVLCSNLGSWWNRGSFYFPQLSNLSIYAWDKRIADNIPAIQFLNIWPTDLGKFRPSDSHKTAIRESLNLPVNSTLCLHVGHGNRGRNLEELLNLPKNVHLLLILSTSVQVDESLLRKLRESKSSLTIINRFVSNIECYYQAADYYCFPVRDKRFCIDLPLSIVEAIACDTLVLATPFGAISEGYRGIRLIRSLSDWKELGSHDEGAMIPNIVSWEVFFDSIA